MFTFQRDDFQVLEKDNSCGKTDKRLENIYIQLKQTEFTIANLLKKMLSKFYIKRGRGPLVRKKPVWGLVKLRRMLMPSWSSTKSWKLFQHSFFQLNNHPMLIDSRWTHIRKIRSLTVNKKATFSLPLWYNICEYLLIIFDNTYLLYLTRWWNHGWVSYYLNLHYLLWNFLAEQSLANYLTSSLVK